MRLAGALHHVGLTVSDLDRSAQFWSDLLGAPASAVEHLAGPGIGRLVGYPGVKVDRRWVRLAGVVDVELLRYVDRGEDAYPPGTAHPGNVHVCLAVDDVASARHHALGCGAGAVGEGWIEVPTGPNAGARIAYVRDPDGVTVELFQPAPRPG